MKKKRQQLEPFINTAKHGPTLPECSYGEHHANDPWIRIDVIESEMSKMHKRSVIQYTCTACGERWFTPIRDKYGT